MEFISDKVNKNYSLNKLRKDGKINRKIKSNSDLKFIYINIIIALKKSKHFIKKLL